MPVEPYLPDDRHPVEGWTHLYEVRFWSQREPAPGQRPEDASWFSEVWHLRAEDVHEVIEWADAKALADRTTYTLLLRLEDGRGPGEDLMVQIAGADPTHVDSSDGFLRRHPRPAA